MKYTKDQAMTLVGLPTPKAVIHKSESHKLHQAFPVAKGVNIIQGMPVMLKTDGTIAPYMGEGIYLGIAVTNSDHPCYKDAPAGVDVTVMVEGFAIVYGVSSAELSAGAVKPTELKDDSMYVTYATDAQATDPKFISLQSASAADELVQILVR